MVKTRQIFLLLSLLLFVPTTHVNAQDIPWLVDKAPSSKDSSTEERTTASANSTGGMHEAYFPGQPGVYDSRYYDGRSGWINTQVPTMSQTLASFAPHSNLAAPLASGALSRGLGNTANVIVDIWNMFTGKDWWKGFGSVLSFALATRVGGFSSALNPRIALDQQYLRRPPLPSTASTGGRVVTPGTFHDCQDCDRVEQRVPGQEVGEVLRHVPGQPPFGQRF